MSHFNTHQRPWLFPKPRHAFVAGLGMMAAFADVGHARQDQPPAQGPPPQSEPADRPEQEVIDGLRSRPSESQPVSANPGEGASGTMTVPGLEARNYRVAMPSLLPEGTFLTPRRATMLRAGNGEWFVVFHAPEAGRPLPPMALLPSPVLEELEAAISAEASGRLVVRIAGQVFVYHRRNVLLPQAWSLAPEARLSEGDASPDPVNNVAANGNAPSNGREPADDPSVEELIAELQAATDAPRALDHQSLARPTSGETPEGEGTAAPAARSPAFLIRRKARVVRVGGAWSAVFEAGAGDHAMDEAPMVLMPGQNLMRIEGLASARGDAIAFELSGQIVRYRGRRLLVPTFHRALQPSEIGPRP